MTISVAINGAVVVSVAGALVALPMCMSRPVRERASPEGWSGGPGSALALVTCLIFVNQLLFTVYVIRTHHGDASFIARYLPEGWFDLAAGNAAIEAVARHFPAVGLL